MSDLETVPTAASARTRRMPDGELVFAVEHALEVIQACTSSEIAVLGIEIFPGLNVSTYDREVKDLDAQIGRAHGSNVWQRRARFGSDPSLHILGNSSTGHRDLSRSQRVNLRSRGERSRC